MTPTVFTLLKVPVSNEHGEAPFWKEWGVRYLERFVRGIRRFHPDWPIRVLTDWRGPSCEPWPDWLEADVRRIPLKGDALGWWAKLNLFRPDVSRGTVLYSDLDNVISSSLEPLLDIPREPIVMLDDRKYDGVPNGALMLYQAELMPDLWGEYCANPLAVESAFASWPNGADQGFIADRVLKAGGTVRLAQDSFEYGRIMNARMELERGEPWDKAMLVYGSWHPKPHESKSPYYTKWWT